MEQYPSPPSQLAHAAGPPCATLRSAPTNTAANAAHQPGANQAHCRHQARRRPDPETVHCLLVLQHLLTSVSLWQPIPEAGTDHNDELRRAQDVALRLLHTAKHVPNVGSQPSAGRHKAAAVVHMVPLEGPDGGMGLREDDNRPVVCAGAECQAGCPRPGQPGQ